MNKTGKSQTVATRITAIVLTAGSCVCPGVAHAGVLDDYRAQVQAMQADLLAMDEAWHRAVARLKRDSAEEAGIGDLRVLRLSLRKAVEGRDLEFAVYRAGKHDLRRRAWAPEWNRVEHDVDSFSLGPLDAAGPAGVTGRLVLRLIPDGFVPIDGEPLAAAFDLNGTVREGRISGRYAVVNPDPDRNDKARPLPSIAHAVGSFTGEIRPVHTELPPPAGLPWPKAENLDPYQLSAESLRLLDEAERTYQRIRAVVMAATHRMPLDEALRRCIVPRPVFPRLVTPEKRKADRIARTGGPTLDDVDPSPAVPDEPSAERRPGKAAGTSDPQIESGAVTVQAIRDRLGRLRGLVEDQERVGLSAPVACQRDSLDPGDPLFHPFYQTREPLAHSAQKPNTIARDAGVDGPLNWAPVVHWRRIGPFPLGDWYEHLVRHGIHGPTSAVHTIRWTTLLPGMPDVVLDDRTTFLADPFPGGAWGSSRYKGPATLVWTPITPYNSFGYLAPPYAANRNPTYGEYRKPPCGDFAGMDFGACYAQADVYAESAVELWAALGIQVRGALWVNGDLHWAGPSDWQRGWVTHQGFTPPGQRAESVIFTRIPFRPGLNRLLLRVENGVISPHFWLRLCTSGRPKNAEAAARFEGRVADARARLARPTQGMGFRNDGTAVFGGADPPGAWDIRRRQNVLWYTPLPFWCNASPVVAGDRLFVCTEPDRLLCLHKEDGRILWERHVNAIDLMEEDLKQEGWRLYNAWWEARIERDRIPAGILRQQAWIERGHPYYWDEARKAAPAADERRGASPELLALLDKRDELEQAPDPQAVQEELTRVLDRIRALKEVAKTDNPEVAQAQQAAKKLDGAWAGLCQFMNKHHGVSRLDGYWTDYDGYAFATPVSDGRSVWWKNGYGAAACFDMEGNRRWLVSHKGLGHGAGTISSPLLVDGKLVMMLVRANPEGGGRGRSGRSWAMVALDAETGREVWETRVAASGWGAGTCAAVRLTNGETNMAVIVTPSGMVIRADDGRRMVDSLGAVSGDASVAVNDDVVVFCNTPTTAIRLMMLNRDTVGWRVLWRRGDGTSYGGVMVADGCVHRPDSADIENGAGERWAGYERIDLATGTPACSLAVVRKGGNYWSLWSASARHVYTYGGDNIFCGAGNKQPMTSAVLTRGPDPLLLACSAVERSYGGAAMDGQRMYLRGYRGVCCVGYTGDEGRAFEARVVAGTLLDRMQARKPSRDSAVRTQPDPGFAGTGCDARRAPLQPGVAFKEWRMIGPFEAASAPPVPDEIVNARYEGRDAAVQPADKAWKFAPMGQHAASLGKPLPPWLVDTGDATLIDAPHRRIVDLGRAVDYKPASVTYLYTELDNREARTVRLELTTVGTRTWVAGAELRGEERIALRRGTVPVLLEVRIGERPSEGPFVSPVFWESGDPAQEESAWLKFAMRIRPYLERVVSLAPDSPEAERARVVLAGSAKGRPPVDSPAR